MIGTAAGNLDTGMTTMASTGLMAPGSATAVGDGWVIGTDRRGGGYGIYRWSGRGWNRVAGGAVDIGGSYEQPWVINNRGEQFYWNGYDWSADGGGYQRHVDDRRHNDRRR